MSKRKTVLITVFSALIITLMSLFAVACGNNNVKLEFITGENAQPIAAQKVRKGEEVVLPVPEAEGFEFDGWYLNSQFSGGKVEKYTAKQNTSFYAKWNPLAKITLDLNGGSLDKTSLYLKANSNLYNFMQNYQPTKSGFQFGAWFNGDKELSSASLMPAEGITLTAKYKIEYTVKVYKQTLDLQSYELDKDVLTAYDYVGKDVYPEIEVEGFVQKSNPHKVLTDNAADNVFEINYDRKNIKVSYYSGYDLLAEKEVIYGTKVAVASDFTQKGLCLIGWSETRGGELKYRADYLQSVLYNGEEQVPSAEEFTPSEDISLYAVWQTGYADMLGGEDYIFLFDEKPTEIYLLRNGVMFKGTYLSTSKRFTFNISDDPNSKTAVLRGKLVSDAQFIYRDPDRYTNGKTFYNYDIVTGEIDRDSYFIFGDYDDVTLNEAAGQSTGIYSSDDDLNYVVKFDGGVKKGKTVNFLLGTVAEQGGDTDVYLIRNEEEFGYGALKRLEYAFYKNSYGIIYNTSNQLYDLTLSGFNYAVFISDQGPIACNYVKDENGVIRLLNTSNNKTLDVIKLLPYNIPSGYMAYYEKYDNEFTLDNGDTLTLDGLYSGVYRNGGKEYEGHYFIEDSLFGGVIVTFHSEEKTCKFVITESLKDATTVYTVVERPETYSEFDYKSADDVLSTVKIVLDSPTAGSAELYGYTTAGNFVKVSSGTYGLDDATGYYVYTAENYYDVNGTLTDDAPVDLKQVKSLVFSVGSFRASSNVYNVHYWFTATENVADATPENFFTDFANGNDKLVLLENAGIAICTLNGGQPFMNVYSADGDIVEISDGQNYYYFKLNRANNTFTKLPDVPFTAYLLDKTTGMASQTEYVKFNGEWGADYVVLELVGGLFPQEVARYSGTYTKTGNKSIFGSDIYTFTPSDSAAEIKTFEYILLYTNSGNYFCKYDSAVNGVFTSEKKGSLKLDGFCLQAEYTDKEGTVTSGIYVQPSENMIIFVTEDEEEFYIDLTLDGKTFDVRGWEYNENGYVYVNNQVITGNYITFDGYGKFELITYDENDKEVLLAAGDYTVNGEEISFTYELDEQEFDIVGKTGVMEYSGKTYSMFGVKHEEIVNTYVSEEDWSVIKVDSYGNVEKYNAMGVKESGTFSIITENLLYFVNETSDNANIFIIDSAKKTVKIPKFEAKGYYTSDLDSLFFSQYGFAIFNGTERYYYNISEDKSIVIYKRDPANADANVYGYVEELFDTDFHTSKEYNGQTYYLTEGFGLIFNRLEGTKYPIKQSDGSVVVLKNINFQPNGYKEFDVTGVATYTITDKNGNVQTAQMNCGIVREFGENDVLHLYAELGNYRMEINVNYQGDADSMEDKKNSFTVLGLEYIMNAYSNKYVSTLELFYSMFGSQAFQLVGNNNGAIWITDVFDENGDFASRNFRGIFLSESGIRNSKNLLISEVVGECEENANGTYTVTFVDNGVEEERDENGEVIQEARAGDGYTYKLTVALDINESFGVYVYDVFTFTREQTLTTADGKWTAETEKLIASDYYGNAGGLYVIKLKDESGNVLESKEVYEIDGNIYYIVREYDGNEKITGTKYYKVVLNSEIDSSADANNKVALYSSVEITEINVTTHYNEAGDTYADITDNKVQLFYIGETLYIPTECNYDEETATYTVKAGEKTFTIAVNAGIITVTEVTAA